MYDRPFRNVLSYEGSASGKVTFNLPWPSGQVTVSNDSSGVNMEVYLGLNSSETTVTRRMTLAGGETISFEIGVRQVTLSAAGAANGYRLWVLG